MTDTTTADDLSVLLEEAGFEPDFSIKAKAIFEAKLAEKLDEQKEANEELIEAAVVERTEALEDKLDSYLSYISEEFMEENKIAIEAGQKVMAAEHILEGIQELMVEQHLTVPENSVEMVESLEDELEGVTARLDTRITENVDLRQEVADLKREIILDTLSEGLSDQQTEKLETLTEDFSIGNEKAFISKVRVVRESFVEGKAGSLTEDVLKGKRKVVIKDHSNDFMSAIVATLKKTA